MTSPTKPPKAPKPPLEQDELPVVDSVGWVRTKTGWTVVFLRTQGDRVIEKEIIAPPDIRPIAHETLRRTVVHRLLLVER